MDEEKSITEFGNEGKLRIIDDINELLIASLTRSSGKKKNMELSDGEARFLRLLAERLVNSKGRKETNEELDDEEVYSLASNEVFAPVKLIEGTSQLQVSDLSCFNDSVATKEMERLSSRSFSETCERSFSETCERNDNDHSSSSSMTPSSAPEYQGRLPCALAKADTQTDDLPPLLCDSFGDSSRSHEVDKLDLSDRAFDNTATNPAPENAPKKKIHRSSLVSRNSYLDPEWFASRGLLSASSMKRYKKETKKNKFNRSNSADSTIATSLSMLNLDNDVSPVEITCTDELRRELERVGRPTYSRSVSLNNGIESVTDPFVRSLTMSSDSEKMNDFASLVLNKQKATVVDEIVKKLAAQATRNCDKYRNDDDVDVKSMDSVERLPIANIKEDGTQLRVSDLSCFDDDTLSASMYAEQEVAANIDRTQNKLGTDFELSYLSMSTGKLWQVVEESISDSSHSVSIDELSVSQRKRLLEKEVDDDSISVNAARGVANEDDKQKPSSKNPSKLAQVGQSRHPLGEAARTEQQKQISAYEIVDLDESDNNSSSSSESMRINNANEERKYEISSDTQVPSSSNIDPTKEEEKQHNECLNVFSVHTSSVSSDVNESVTSKKGTSQDSLSRYLNHDINLIDEGIAHLSIVMLALLYRKLREMSLLGHVSVKLRDIDVNSYQAISRQKEMKRRGLMTTEEESKGFLDRTRTAGFIVRSVLDEYQMFKESTDLLSLNSIDQVTAEYDASMLAEINTLVETQNGDPFGQDSLMKSLVDNEVEVVWFSDRHPNDLIYGICVSRRTRTVTVVFRGQESAFARIKDSEMTSYPNPIADEEYVGNKPTLRLRSAVSEELLRVRRDSSQTAVEFIRDKVKAIGKELGDSSPYHLTITGHGLAGGYATLLGFYLASDPTLDLASAVRVFTFASSRVGCSDFESAFRHLEDLGLILHARFTNQNDMVSLRPFFDIKGSWWFKDWYRHVGMHIILHGSTSSCRHAFDVEYNKESTFSIELAELLRSYVCGRMSDSQVSEYHHRLVAAVKRHRGKWMTLEDAYLIARNESLQDDCMQHEGSNSMLLLIATFVLLQVGAWYLASVEFFSLTCKLS